MTDNQVLITQIQDLDAKIKSAQIPQELSVRVLDRLDQLSKLTGSSSFLPEIDKMIRYVDWITNLPWETKTTDNLDVVKARDVLEKHHYGLTTIKDRIIEYVSVMSLKNQRNEEEDFFRAPILCFVGLVGTGKTTIAKSIAEALGREFVRIPFGGMGSPFDLRGQSRVQLEAEPGKVIKALRAAKSRNPVILLDEIDRVTEEGRASIMGVLVELLDPEQNNAFTDHYIDFPFNLSEVLFVATANNTRNISTAVMDRLEPIMMPSYSDEEKIMIGKKYMLPKVLAATGLKPEDVIIDDDAWAKITRPLGFDAGIRTLERTIQGVARKIAKMTVDGNPGPYHITTENAREFLPQL